MENKTIIKKASGRKQAMTNTFNRLLTNPREYSPIVNKAYCHIENCELCGAALDYSFKLEHFEDKNFTEGKSLYVGSDCIVNFVETYVPDMAKQIILSIEKSVETAKIGKFRKNNPTILEDMNKISEILVNYRKEFGWTFYNLTEVVNFKDSLKKLKRTEYLSAPSVEKFKIFQEKVTNGKLLSLLIENNEIMKKQSDEVNSNSSLIEEDDKKFIKLYKANEKDVYLSFPYSYKEVMEFKSKNKMPKLSKLQKQIYLEKVETYKEKKLKNEKKWLKLIKRNEAVAA